MFQNREEPISKSRLNAYSCCHFLCKNEQIEDIEAHRVHQCYTGL